MDLDHTWDDVPDLDDVAGPSTRDLTVLERIRRRRKELKAVEPSDSHEAIVLRYLVETLDGMEEAVCLHGHAAPGLEDGWQTVEALETFRLNGGPPMESGQDVQGTDEQRPDGWDRT